ncbi:MAG: hypothetical protein LJF04_12150, partial [Gemmatimonadetes bacterium]|nr:hypothetical protein [Gemmatimonadota bacterium]
MAEGHRSSIRPSRLAVSGLRSWDRFGYPLIGAAGCRPAEGKPAEGAEGPRSNPRFDPMRQ